MFEDKTDIADKLTVDAAPPAKPAEANEPDKKKDKEPDIIPVALLRPLITPPRTGQADDPPVWVFACPYSSQLFVLTDDYTLFPFTYSVYGWPVVLELGYPLFVGSHLLKGHPDDFPDALFDVLKGRYEDDRRNGRRHHWLPGPPVRTRYGVHYDV